MQTIVVVGADTVVGANLAAILSDSFHVFAIGSTADVDIAGCESAAGPLDDDRSARRWMASVHPSHVVVCGAGAQSTWQQDETVVPTRDDINIGRTWARVAAEFECHLTLISSDAVFTGPWMFHREESEGICPSTPAGILRQIEQDTWQLCPDALIVRTHAIGWMPDSMGPGWIEQTLNQLNAGTAGPFDYLRHSTPILATELAKILVKAWEAGLEGEYHIAGSERINPGRFVERLAEQFQLPAPKQPADCAGKLPTGFGVGESSLHTGKIREALGISMPTISDAFTQLREQCVNGFCDRLSAPAAGERQKVA